MPLFAPHWNTNNRLRAAAINAPGMAAFDPDQAAVRLLQQALAITGILPTIKVDGIYGQQTAGAVRALEKRFNLTLDGGAAGRQVMGVLDLMLRGALFAADLARLDVPLATSKVRAALAAITALQAARAAGTPPAALTMAALRTHFRLSAGGPRVGNVRAVTAADLVTISTRYTQLVGLYGAAATRFRTAAPVNGIETPAEAPLGGPVTFGPAFTNVQNNFGDPTGQPIGPNSRVAILIHEGVHVFDGQSGANNAHISEFEPAYDTQSSELSLHNPSSFAGFAAHIVNGSDPSPRFGLGAAQAQ
jgi:peptidoglycan hydrolase-like protein with peptidoglycan-binding domain